MTVNQPIVVLGAGSIGERHIRNLWSLGYKNIIVYRQRNLALRDIGKAAVKIFTNWNEIVCLQPLAAIICTPTSQHLKQTFECIEAGMHVLVEKPLAHKDFNDEELVSLAVKKNRLIQVGYMLRYHPLLQKAKSFIEHATYGNLVNIQSYWGEYLPGWHPWEDYKISYAASKDMGGGAALTLSHDIDAVNWLTGCLPAYFKTIHNYKSQLNINADAAFDAIFSYTNNVTDHVHVNFCQ